MEKTASPSVYASGAARTPLARNYSDISIWISERHLRGNLRIRAARATFAAAAFVGAAAATLATAFVHPAAAALAGAAFVRPAATALAGAAFAHSAATVLRSRVARVAACRSSIRCLSVTDRRECGDGI